MKASFDQEIVRKNVELLWEESGFNANRFATECNIDVSNFRKKIAGKLPWTLNDVDKFISALNVRRGWLMEGTGEKFKAPKEFIEQVRRDNPKQPSKGKENEGIPLIPTNAMAGSLNGADYQFMPYDVETYFVVPTFAKSDFCIRVEGNSMEPTYYKGDIIACKYVPMSGLWFQWGKVYVVATNQGVLVKHIEKGHDQKHVTLVSDNPAYQPFEIPTSDIYSVAIINGLIRVE